MPIIAILNQKGGVGKTTTAVNLAYGLAEREYKTLLVDLDGQGNVCDALGLTKQPGIWRLLVAKMAWREVVISSGDNGARRRLDVIPGDKNTVEAKMHLTAQPFREQALRKALLSVHTSYNFCILDLAPSLDVLHVGALVAADAFLVVTRLDHLAVVGVNDALLTLSALKEGGEDPPEFLGVLPTFWDRTTKESDHQLAALARAFGPQLWPPIPKDVKAREAPAYGQTLWEYAPKSRAVMGVEVSGKQTGGYNQALDRLIEEVQK